MSLTGFALVLAAAICHALWNFSVKKINGGPELIWLFSVCSVLIYFPFVLFIFNYQPIHASHIVWWFVAGSAVLHLGYFLLLQTGYRIGDLSLVYPIARATGPLLSSAFAVILFSEHLSLQSFVGGVLIIFSVSRLGSAPAGKGPSRLISIAFGLSAGVLIGTYTLWDSYTVSTLMFPPLLLDYVSSLGRCGLLAGYAYQRQTLIARYWHEQKGWVLCIAVFNPLAYILVLYALTFTPVVYVAPAREMSVLFSVLLGAILLREGDLRRRLFWAVWIILGSALLTTG